MPPIFVVVVGLLGTPFQTLFFRRLDFDITSYISSSCLRLLTLSLYTISDGKGK